ncbi:MAG: DUF2062 domain-containing protein [Bacteroidales bacterium]|jgi:uncharacterized protein (DUF2062 family)|nr:DUF2062 domain-containing protein [Bacteroidales bacterium]
MFKSFRLYITTLHQKPRDLYRRIKSGELKKIFREQILHAQDSNLKIAASIGFGIFMSIFPIWGFQTLAAIFLAIFFRLNKAIVIIAVNISIPPVIPVFLYISFIIGGLLLNQSVNIAYDKQFDFKNIQNDLVQYYFGAIIFAIISGIIIGLISYFLLLLFKKERNS